MIKKIIVCAATLILATRIQVFAETNTPTNIILEGNAEGIVFIPGDEPFLIKEDMVPGDSVSRKMIINNEYDTEYEVFMRAERVSEEEEYDLLKKLELTIYYKDEIIYNGAASGENGLDKNISLGKFKSGEQAELYAEVTLDGPSTGNEYRNKYAEVEWIFTAINEGDENITNTNNPSTNKPTTTNRPNSTNNKPLTGDSGIAIYIIVVLGGLILLSIDKIKNIVKRGE